MDVGAFNYSDSLISLLCKDLVSDGLVLLARDSLFSSLVIARKICTQPAEDLSGET